MADASIARAGLEGAVARFPHVAPRLRRLALADRRFRGSADLRGSTRLRARASPASRPARTPPLRPEIGDYRSVIAELEGEIDRFLREAEPER